MPLPWRGRRYSPHGDQDHGHGEARGGPRQPRRPAVAQVADVAGYEGGHRGEAPIIDGARAGRGGGPPRHHVEAGRGCQEGGQDADASEFRPLPTTVTGPACAAGGVRPRMWSTSRSSREKRNVFHALECARCGHIVRPRYGTVKGTFLAPCNVALVGSLNDHCWATRRESRPAAPPSRP